MNIRIVQLSAGFGFLLAANSIACYALSIRTDYQDFDLVMTAEEPVSRVESDSIARFVREHPKGTQDKYQTYSFLFGSICPASQDAERDSQLLLQRLNEVIHIVEAAGAHIELPTTYSAPCNAAMTTELSSTFSNSKRRLIWIHGRINWFPKWENGAYAAPGNYARSLNCQASKCTQQNAND
ncbi:hypothetical protein [Cupriavidus sp. BIS7]|uniref:hypothetical protein n=1 Tax=Cupriavidus sp. BIS7 TaxID=1217718 RepID=UPI0012F69D94|nr:hypothetical protein [Cupriavidus sp. BIS7]